MRCNKRVFTTTGAKRKGRCIRKIRHGGLCGNNFCSMCGQTPKIRSYAWCRFCRNSRQRKCRGYQPRNFQKPGKLHTFPCGCTGILPKRGQSNKFAVWSRRGWACRILAVIVTSRSTARRGKYKSINKQIPHSAIRLLMEEPNCERCKKPLKWEFGKGKTPHLHHNHKTGKLFGFTHPRCNSQALEDEIERLKKKLDKIANTRV